MTLVINEDIFLPYVDRYKVFEDDEEAVKYAKSLGFESMLGVNHKIGVLNMYACGDVKISFMKLKVINKNENKTENG